MGSPETCPTCGTDRPAAAWYCDFGLPSRFRSHALNGVARDGWALCPDLFHRPTPPAPADDARGEPMPGYFTCPKCRSHEWGTSNCTSPYSEWVGHCHNYRCGFSWPREKDDAKYFEYAPAPDAGWEPWGNPYPRHPDVIRTRDACCDICVKHQAFDAAAEIRVMHLPPAPDAGAAERAVGEARDAERFRWLMSRNFGFAFDAEKCGISTGRWGEWPEEPDEQRAMIDRAIAYYAYDEEQRDAGAAERAVVEALTALRDRFAALITRNPDFGATDWALVEQADAALRGTNQGDQPKAGHEAEGREGA